MTEKGKSIIQTNNHENLRRYSVSSGSQRGRKKKKKREHTPHHLSATCQVYSKGGAMGGAVHLGLEAYWPSLEGQALSSAQLAQLEVTLTFLFLGVTPSRGGKREEREEKGREQEKGRMEGEKGGGRELSLSSDEASLSHLLAPHLNVRRALAGTYCGAAVHWGHLPLWACLTAFLHGKKLPCFPTSPCQPSPAPLGHRLLCQRLQWRPWQERTFHLVPCTEP